MQPSYAQMPSNIYEGLALAACIGEAGNEGTLPKPPDIKRKQTQVWGTALHLKMAAALTILLTAWPIKAAVNPDWVLPLREAPTDGPGVPDPMDIHTLEKIVFLLRLFFFLNPLSVCFDLISFDEKPTCYLKACKYLWTSRS